MVFVTNWDKNHKMYISKNTSNILFDELYVTGNDIRYKGVQYDKNG